jgi:hypothetical protein
MIEKKCEAKRLLEIDNLHSAECGPPPSLNAADRYVGYYENSYGEQWVFIGDRKTGTAAIRGGDIGWPTQHIISRDEPYPSGLILGNAEKQWIIACFMGMCNASYDAVGADFKADDPMATAVEYFKALTEGQAVNPPGEQGTNGGKGDSRKDEGARE